MVVNFFLIEEKCVVAAVHAGSSTRRKSIRQTRHPERAEIFGRGGNCVAAG